MATQQDVARLAGTSVATVSYVINNGPRPVAESTRQKVLAAIAELDFRPNRAARSLRSGKSQVLGLVVPDSSHPFFAEVARQMEAAAYERGHVILTGNSLNQPARELEYFAQFREHQVDGVLLTVDPEAPLSSLSDARIPVVLMDQPTRDLPISSVSVDYERAAFDATSELIRGGHRRIAFVGGEPGLPSADGRRSGWQRALDEAGLASDRATHGAFSRENGYVSGRALLEGPEQRPTAVFVSSDQQAVGLLRAASELGLRSPDDLWVMAFDDSDDCLYTTPQLSTVRQPTELMIRRAIDLMLDPPQEPLHETFDHDLVLRGSTGGDATPIVRPQESKTAPSRTQHATQPNQR